MEERRRALLKNLPKIDEIVHILERKGLCAMAPKEIVRDACRRVVERERLRIMDPKGDAGTLRLPSIDVAAREAAGIIQGLHRYRLRRVVNATGIILHTNLGRSPLCPEALERLQKVGEGYSNLEYDLERGQRGVRYDHVRELLCALSGAEDALVVNNNAAAVLLVLNTLAEGKEAVVSRGELIEIGGEFRIPEIMEKSGALLREVGTTNRTHLSDYEKALCEKTGLILKVHTSNYRIVGFTQQVDLTILAALGRKSGIPVMNDLGSGCFVELDRYGLEREPTVQDVLQTGVDVVTFSGDKLLGGPQAGIILGGREMLGRIKRNPLNRALRIDKFTLAALEATMMQYLQPEEAMGRLRVLRALSEPLASVKRRARRLLLQLRRLNVEGMTFSLKDGLSLTGGGSLPTQGIPTCAVSVKAVHLSADRLERRLRDLETPIVARISDDEVLLDLRTVDPGELSFIKEGFSALKKASSPEAP
ncbi:MAG: L-seryl-tRNA(Sec) selenium transferase [Deltaproteobacteria bacterium]|nr:L-seryl-tRNA(Sec) selenium transferase [Deltaproteobacteria bacterium]